MWQFLSAFKGIGQACPFITCTCAYALPACTHSAGPMVCAITGSRGVGSFDWRAVREDSGHDFSQDELGGQCPGQDLSISMGRVCPRSQTCQIPLTDPEGEAGRSEVEGAVFVGKSGHVSMLHCLWKCFQGWRGQFQFVSPKFPQRLGCLGVVCLLESSMAQNSGRYQATACWQRFFIDGLVFSSWVGVPAVPLGDWRLGEGTSGAWLQSPQGCFCCCCGAGCAAALKAPPSSSHLPQNSRSGGVLSGYHTDVCTVPSEAQLPYLI